MTNKYNPTTYLKPCPFCGSHDIDPTGVMSGEENKDFHNGPACDDCGAHTHISENKELSIDAWNRRVLPQPPQGDE